MDKQVNTSNFVPDYMAKSLLDVDFKALQKRGIRFVAFDADSTLVNFRATSLSAETKAFLQKQRPLFEDWCIASNRLTNDLLPLAESIDAQVVRAGLTVRKPRLKFFDQVIKLFGAKPGEIAMVGDKLFADIWGANRAGMVTVWVERLGTDSPWDRLFATRALERKILQRYSK